MVLRNVEKTPSDLLSFLLPLVQDNILHVTSAMTIVPKLGFRLVALCHSSKNTDDIRALLHYMHKVELKRLEQRGDFEEILNAKYPAVSALKSLNQTLRESVDYLDGRLNGPLKFKLLDHKQASVRQIFKLFGRVEAYLRQHFKLDELTSSDFYMATTTVQNIIEEIVDVYLTYLYDQQVKG